MSWFLTVVQIVIEIILKLLDGKRRSSSAEADDGAASRVVKDQLLEKKVETSIRRNPDGAALERLRSRWSRNRKDGR